MWSKENTDLLIKLHDVDKLPWPKVAPHFPGRSVQQCRVRYHSVKAYLRDKPGRLYVRARLGRPPHRDAKRQNPKDVIPKERTSLTAELLGDPRPGQSALDKIRAGIVDGCSSYARPKPTLAWEPMR